MDEFGDTNLGPTPTDEAAEPTDEQIDEALKIEYEPEIEDDQPEPEQGVAPDQPEPSTPSQRQNPRRTPSTTRWLPRSAI